MNFKKDDLKVITERIADFITSFCNYNPDSSLIKRIYQEILPQAPAIMPLAKFVFKSQPKKYDFSFGDLDYKKSIANSMFFDLESSRMTDV